MNHNILVKNIMRAYKPSSISQTCSLYQIVSLYYQVNNYKLISPLPVEHRRGL